MTTLTTTTATMHGTAAGGSTGAVLDRYVAALVAGNLDTVAASLAADATWTLYGTLPLAGTERGREAIMAFLVGAGALYAPGTQTFEFADATVEADRAVLEWRVRGTATATGSEFHNAPAEGQPRSASRSRSGAPTSP